MRTKFSNNELAHAWFHKTEGDYGSNSNGSFYFDNDVIYSYGAHFPIARVDREKNVVLFTTDSYSNTTAAHMGKVRIAIPHNVTVYNVTDVNAHNKECHKRNYKDMLEDLQELYKKATRARSKLPFILQYIERLTVQANGYTKLYKLGFKSLELQSDTADMKAQLDELERKQAAREKVRQRKLQKENKERIDAWLAGENVGRLYGISKVFMRVESDVIRTSHGVTFPVDDAIRAFALIKRVVNSGNSVDLSDSIIRLGHYKIDSVSSTGTVVAGCHTVEYDQIERCAKELNLI